MTPLTLRREFWKETGEYWSDKNGSPRININYVWWLEAKLIENKREEREAIKKEFHNALDEVVSFDDNNQKSNFILDVLKKIK